MGWKKQQPSGCMQGTVALKEIQFYDHPERLELQNELTCDFSTFSIPKSLSFCSTSERCGSSKLVFGNWKADLLIPPGGGVHNGLQWRHHFLLPSSAGLLRLTCRATCLVIDLGSDRPNSCQTELLYLYILEKTGFSKFKTGIWSRDPAKLYTILHKRTVKHSVMCRNRDMKGRTGCEQSH